MDHDIAGETAVENAPAKARRLAAFAAIWLSVGVLSGVQVFAFRLGMDTPVAIWDAVSAQLLMALPWIPATPLIVHVADRNPFVGGRQDLFVLGVHLVAGVILVVLLNMVQTFLTLVAGCPLGCESTFTQEFKAGILAWGHFGLLAYGIVVAIALWVRSRRAEIDATPVRGESDARPLESLTVTIGRRKQIIPVSKIDWIEASGDYVSLHSGDETYLCASRMAELERMLDRQQFARIHRSTIVNLSRVRAHAPLSHGDCSLELESGARLKLTRSRRKEVLKRLERVKPIC